MIKKNKKKFIIGAAFSISVLLFILISPQGKQNKTLNTSNITKQNIPPSPQRTPASLSSIAKNTSIPLKKRAIIGTKGTTKDLHYTNKFNKHWKKKYRHNFFRMVGKKNIADFKIQTKKSLVKINNNSGTLLEHIVVSYKKPDGKPFSFEALIDSETGSVVQTWNQTRYEFKKPIIITEKTSQTEYFGP